MPGELLRTDVGDLTFDVRVDGPEDGRPVLLLHGFPETSASWAAVTPLLTQAGLRTYAPDQLGYSPGARPSEVEAYAMQNLAQVTADLMTALEVPVADVVGHDWGANVAWTLGAWHPDRVRSLTAVSVPHPAAYTAAFRIDPEQKERSSYIRLFWQPGKAEEVLLADDARRLRRMLLGADGDTGVSPEAVDEYVAVLSAPGALTAALNWYRAMSSDIRVDKVEVPTTYVWSDGDVAIGRTAAEACAEFVTGDYRFVELPGVTHWIPEQAPEELARAILDRVAST
ncbi:alpha/beta hydrolase [Blastococcus sp. MG754426]|uniref:alpha/beta fold hydrolase n=1 Tax=unclassified Blastococcus TaxID=2619396 RepID=UPI001EF0C69A|nr:MULTISPECIES: alpha/beta hydrolase [unclassified Blastococcus]MCF6509110.1 alpha/beta hydrolase [Blastococcus sp. MG754426]MCF6512908.1 alpha/beta hydrolase [Blastococcus sp. MG754427]MCF6735908.1 alpha/beta hydrolase [Blastococcus sp. KM273129]